MSVVQSIAVFLCGVVALHRAQAQVPMLGACPEIPAKREFELSRYLGKWYEAERYFAVFQLGGKCVTADYSEASDGGVKVLNRQTSMFSGMKTSIEGEATLASKDSEAKLLVRFPSVPFNVAAPYWVIDTDYDNYAVVWSCNDFGLLNTQFSWILTRERNPSVSVMEKAYEVLDNNRISKAYFTRTDQKNCPEDNEVN